MIGLAPLLTALREAGLPVGIAEMGRLQRVFSLSPPPADRPGDDRLRGVLRAVLVKSAEDRAVFERVFAAWREQVEHEVRRQETPARSIGEQVITPAQPRRRRSVGFRWRAAAAALLLGLTLSLGGHVVGRPRGTARVEAPPASPASRRPVIPRPTSSQPAASTPEAIRRLSFNTSVPILTEKPGLWRSWLPLGLGMAALTTAVSLWRALDRRKEKPGPAPKPSQKGPPRVFLSPPASSGLQLLQPREEEALVWGIGNFVAEEPTRRLDLPATVRATARAAGVPHLSFHAARYPREVWLWIDEAADDPAVPRLAEEVTAALEAHSLPVEQALFRGVPDWLVLADGQVFSPNEVDERRDAALVAVLTDGRVLARQYAADDRRMGLDSLLRGLSHWPRLAFVDFSIEPGELGRILAPHGLTTLAPQELAGFLGTDETLRRRTKVKTDDVAVWAAACALAPSSVHESQALELRRRLGLSASPWELRTLRAEAPGPPGRLHWAARDRARRINWLSTAEAQAEEGLAPDSLLGQALGFWEEVYDRELTTRTAGEAGALWKETLAYQHLLMERILLALWNQGDVAGAIRVLYSLHSGALREIIEDQLGRLAPRNWGGPDDLHLPWRWEARSGTEQNMLLEMGLGGGMPPITLRQPGRQWLGLALCLGLAAGALAAAALSGWPDLTKPPVFRHGPGKPPDAWEELHLDADGQWTVTVATRKVAVSQLSQPGARVAVRWETQKRPCVESHREGGEIWSCGSVPAPLRFSESAPRRVVLLPTAPPVSPDNRGAEELAIALLDSGSADAVLFEPGSIDLGLKGQDLVVISPRAPWVDLARRLRFEGTRPIRQVWPGVLLLAGHPDAALRGLSTCRNGETIEEQGMVFVRVCPGTFRMGSKEGDRLAYENERPVHEVSLGEYWMGRHEVTEAQYGTRSGSQLPVTGVSWFEAQSFCEQRGWRLPTEAEWERAARAGTTTAWSFGDDKRVLGEYAWFQENSIGPHPVGSRKGNPWGLYDLHGNVWEWVADWYSPSRAGAQRRPKGPAAGFERVLRGGSFFNPARNLRSAMRNQFDPNARLQYFGFRCAHSAFPGPASEEWD